jgi:putative tryptophan/tyrosine transport system substrate-binding protein
MKRREFISLIGGAAAWPFAACVQQGAMPVVGFLDSRRSDAISDRLRAFRQGLRDSGYVEGENVAIEYRWAENHHERLAALAAELARRQVAVIATGVGAFVAKAATAIPSPSSSSPPRTPSASALFPVSQGRAAI